MKNYLLLMTIFCFLHISAMDDFAAKNIKQMASIESNKNMNIIIIHAERNTEKITIESIIKKVNNASGYQEAQQWLDRFTLLAGADWKYFDEDMIEKYQQVYTDLFDLVTALRPKNKQNVNAFQRLDKEIVSKTKEATWLIKKLNDDECDINWGNFLGGYKFLGITL